MCRCRLTTFCKVLAVFSVACGVVLHEDGPFRASIELRLSRLVRDLSRFKARQRRFGGGNSLALLTQIVTGNDEDLLAAVEAEQGDDQINEAALGVGEGSAEMSLTAEELAYYDGSEPGRPLYLSILGHVFDVSAGTAYYGKGRSYHHFVGRDASRSYCTGCNKPECLVSSLVGLSDTLKLEARRWLELYRLHDKYKYIGKLVEDPVDKILERTMYEEKMLLSEDGSKAKSAPELEKLGVKKYMDGEFEEALIYWRGCLVQIGEHEFEYDGRDDDAIQELSDKEVMRARILNLMAAVALKSRDYRTAIEHYQEALDILGLVLSPVVHDTSILRANILSDQAQALLAQNRAEQAKANLALASDIYERGKLESSNEMLWANTRLVLARAFLQLGDRPAAKSTLQALKSTFAGSTHEQVEHIVELASKLEQAEQL